jgi:hypothetical protein
MTSQQLEERSQQLETRVARLETEVAQMKQMLAESQQQKNPWWLEIAGSCEHDPTFDEAFAWDKNGADLLTGTLHDRSSNLLKWRGNKPLKQSCCLQRI